MRLYRSNSTQALLDQFTAKLHEKPPHPLRPLTYIIDEHCFDNWLSFEVTQKLAIIANTQALFPSAFQRKLLQHLRCPPTNLLDRNHLIWKIHTLLQSPLPPDIAALISTYWKDHPDQPLKKWQLAENLAECFILYNRIRPHWLLLWQQGKRNNLEASEKIQAYIWQRLAKNTPSDEQNIIKRLNQLCTQKKQRLHQAFGQHIHYILPSIDTRKIEWLTKLSHHFNLHIYCFTPSNEYWEPAMHNPSNQDTASFLDNSNPLLESWGNIARSQTDHILSSNFLENELPYETIASGNTCLHAIQQAILSNTPKLPTQTDHSVQLIQAQSLTDELQAAITQTQQFLQQNPHITADKCLIAITNTTPFEHLIPALLLKHNYQFEHRETTQDAWTELIELITILLCSGDLQAWKAILLKPHTLERLACTATEIHQLLNQLIQNGVRNHPFILPQSSWNEITLGTSWQHGLAQLSAGLLYGGQPHLINQQLYSTPTTKNLLQPLQNISTYITSLSQWQQAAPQEATLHDWNTHISQLMAIAFGPEHDILFNQQQWQLQHQAYANTRLNRTTLLEALQNRLPDQEQTTSSSNELRIGSIHELANIPAQHAVIIGLSDELTTPATPNPFDLTIRHPQLGDPTPTQQLAHNLLKIISNCQQQCTFIYSGAEPSSLIAPILNATTSTTYTLPALPATPHTSSQNATPNNALKIPPHLDIQQLIRYWSSPIIYIEQHAGLKRAFTPTIDTDRTTWQSQPQKTKLRKTEWNLILRTPVEQRTTILHHHWQSPSLYHTQLRAHPDHIAKILELQNSLQLSPQTINLSIDDNSLRLYDSAPACTHNNQLLLFLDDSPSSKTHCYIQHLLHCAADSIECSTLIANHTKKNQILNKIPPEQAQDTLIKLILPALTMQPINYLPHALFNTAKKPFNGNIAEDWKHPILKQHFNAFSDSEIKTAIQENLQWIAQPYQDLLADQRN